MLIDPLTIISIGIRICIDLFFVWRSAWSIHLHHHYSYWDVVQSWPYASRCCCLRVSSTSGANFLTLVCPPALKSIYSPSFVATKANLLLALYFAAYCPFFSLIRCSLIFRPPNLLHFNRCFHRLFLEFFCPSFHGYYYSSYIRILSLILMGTVHFERCFFYLIILYISDPRWVDLL